MNKNFLIVKEQQEPAIYNTAPTCRLLINSKFRIVSGDSELEKISGYQVSELQQKHLKEFIESVTNSTRLISYMVDNDIEQIKWETKLLKKDGTLIPVSIRVEDASDKDRITLTISDMTYQMLHQMAMDEITRGFQTIIDSLDTVVFIKTLDGKYLLVNRKFLEVSGCDESDILSSTEAKFMPPETAEYVRQKDQELLTTKKSFIHELMLPGPDGKERWFLSERVPILNDDGEVTSTLGIATDITNRINLQNEVFNSEEKYRSLVSNIPGVSFRCKLDDTWTMLFMSNAVKELTGYPEEDFVQNAVRTFDSIIHKDDRADIAREILKAVSESRPYTIEYRIVTSDEEVKWVWEKGQSSYNSDDVPEWLDGVIFDITDRKHAEDKLKESKAAAEEAAALKSSFLANMSHEIRTPMNSIIGFLQLVLDREALPAELQEYLKTAHNSAKLLLKVINDILDLSKLENSKMELENLCFNLAEVVQETLKTLEFKAKEKNLSLNFNYHEELPECFSGDPSRIRQIIMNLVGNAIKFTERGGVSVDIVPGDIGSRVYFKVIDSGIGISQHKLDSIFESFTQADYSTSRRYGGTGLGTTISRQLVELMKGKIWVESKPGKGSIFHFEIELNEAVCPGKCIRKKDTQAEPVVNRSGFRILLAEDIPQNSRLAELRLKEQGHIVDIAANGEEAVKAYKEESYDIILMDIHMPVMDGIAATKTIRYMERGSEEHIPIVALTASIMQEEQQACLDAGIDDIAGKPINFTQLFTIMDQLIPADRGEIFVPEQKQTSSQRISLDNPGKVINMSEAMSRWGNNIDLYTENLLSFISNHRNDHLIIEGSHRSGDYIQMYQVAHSLKGVAGNLAINKLAESTEKVCHLYNGMKKSGNITPALKEAIKELAQEMEETIKAIDAMALDREMQSAKSPEPHKEKNKSVEEIVMLLKKMDQSLAKSESDDQLFSRLYDSLKGNIDYEDLSELQEAVESFEFDKSRELILNIEQNLSGGSKK